MNQVEAQAYIEAWLAEDQKRKHPGGILRGELKGSDFGWCNGCVSALPLTDFDAAENDLGKSYICKQCTVPKFEESHFQPDPKLTTPKELAEHFEARWKWAKDQGARQIPKDLRKFVEEDFKDEVEFCSKRHIHPKPETKP